MKSKKILSAAVASALVAAQMAMPVMAAEENGFDVTVTTKTPVIRVVVPTTLEVAVNQFGMGDAGSQIYSSPFVMENKSQVPVRVNVTSTATLGAGTKLVGTKAAAEASAAQGEAWLAVAAQTAADTYTDGSTAFADLTEENNNVTAFAQKSGATASAGQTFYLAESSAMAYKLLAANEDATDIKYAQFYQLIPVSFTGTDDTAKGNELKALVAEKDVYSVVTANVSNPGETVTCISKGTASVTYANTNTYYTASITTALPEDVNNTTHTELYVYGDGTTDATDGKAAFRYIGALSGAQETWTKDDISKISVRYNITGVEEAKYDSIYASDCTYGLYKAPICLTLKSGKDNTDVVLEFTPPAGKTLSTGYLSVNGVNASAWSSFKTNIIFDTSANTVTIKGAVFGFSSVTGVTSDHKYTFVVKDTNGTEYATEVLNLAP